MSTSNMIKSLEDACGYDLTIYDANGEKMDSVSFFAPEKSTRDAILLSSYARSLAYATEFLQAGREVRGAYRAHLRDLQRKLGDLIRELN